jgi:predicted  nucleic acid-binding Zn-ribbon protein
LSTLTKILIVLLTLSSIFLCGIVVTYVANADNYRQKYNDLRADKDSLSKKVEALTKQVNENLEQKKQLENKLSSEITSLKVEKGELQTNLDNAEREKAALLQKVNNWTSITKDFYQTTDKQGQLLKNTLDELNKVQAEQISQRKELNETTASLVEKMAIIETLEAENKRILEEKTELQNKLDQFLQPIGKIAAEPVPVTPREETARPATAEAREIALQGLVKAVDLKNSMATISIGTADGVKEGMKFHVTRGDEFLCDILIIDVDAEEAVGALELVQQQPKVGDTVSTNL